MTLHYRYDKEKLLLNITRSSIETVNDLSIVKNLVNSKHIKQHILSSLLNSSIEVIKRIKGSKHDFIAVLKVYKFRFQ